MIYRDNTDVEIKSGRRDDFLKLMEYRKWLLENNIKFSLVHKPVWDPEPCAINMRNEDALMFKLKFGL